DLLRTVKTMSEVKVVRRWADRSPGSAPSAAPVAALGADPRAARRTLVVIGASTGGPLVLRDIVAALPADFAAPIVVVQHMAGGFTTGFVQWLAGAAHGPVLIPQDGDLLQAGQIYVAPEGRHLGLDAGGHVLLSEAPPEHGMRPAVSYLFRSAAAALG